MKLLPYEIWRDIPGYEGFYQASSMGNIRSVDRYVKRFDRRIAGGVTTKSLKGRLMKLNKVGDHRNYYAVMLSKNNHKKVVRVADLVMLAFVGPKPRGMQINHKDENTFNNSISNLEYCTCSYNVNWGTANTRRGKKLSRPVAQLTVSGELLRVWESQEEIERRTNFKQSGISACINGRSNTSYGYKWKFYDKGF